MTNEDSKFYHHDYDSNGMPFSVALNAVTTIFMLKASKEASLAAIALVNDAQLNRSTSEREYQSVKDYIIGDRFVIEIRTNNFIPQLYDAIKANEGVEAINYAVYDSAYTRMISDNESMAEAIKRAYDLNVVLEVDDEPMFPEEFELSLPDLNESN